MKILIVDDHKEDRYMLEVLLRGQGYEVVSATDGVEALEKALHDHFDMIIADILMPRMDGFQLCREVKTNEKLKKIAFVFYTATYTDPKDEKFALSLGAEKFIIKPTEPDVFIEILREVIRACETGILVAPKPPVEEEAVYLREYNERLIKKLEDKMLQLESVNKVLKESEKKYRDLIDNANDVVIVIEPTGYFSFVNPKFCEITGYSMEEAKKLHFRELVHSDDLAMVTENFERVLAGGEIPKNYEFRVLTKSGEVLYAELNATPTEKEGKIVGIQAIVRDVTERKKAEEALRDAYHRLEETQEQLIHAGKMAAMGQLAASISHELNQPLTGIKGFAQSILMDLEEDNPLREDLEKIVTQADKMDKIIQHVRLFARKSEFHMDEIDINQPIEDALMLLNEQLRVHNIRVKKTLSKNLPKIQGDSNQLEQAFLNIITNARDAIDSLKNPEGGEITIQSTLSEDKKNIELTLKDTGCGISKEELGNIFNPFYTTKFPEGGMGLGLSIVYGIIESHKGSICVESKVGKETVFRIILPIA